MIDRIVSIKSDNISAYLMSDELQFKFEVEIKSTDKRQTLPKEVKDIYYCSKIMVLLKIPPAPKLSLNRANDKFGTPLTVNNPKS